MTNALTTAMEIASRPNLKVIMTGGVVRSNSFEAVGVIAEHTFNAINVGTAILGTDGISAAGGATTHDETEARTNNAMVSHAQRVVVVADGSKVGRVTLAKMADLVAGARPGHRHDGRPGRARAHRRRGRRGADRRRLTGGAFMRS